MPFSKQLNVITDLQNAVLSSRGFCGISHSRCGAVGRRLLCLIDGWLGLTSFEGLECAVVVAGTYESFSLLRIDVFPNVVQEAPSGWPYFSKRFSLPECLTSVL